MKKLVFLLWIWGGCLGVWSQEVEWNNFHDAPTRLYREDGPLAGSNIYGQLVAGFERDNLQPLDSPRPHFEGFVWDPGTAVPWAEFGQEVWVQLVVWDRDLWGATLEKVPEIQIGRTEAVRVILSWHPRRYPAQARFRQSAIVPGPSAGLPLAAMQPYAQTWAEFNSSTVLAQTFRALYSGHLTHLTLDLFRGNIDPLPVKVEIYQTENGLPAGPALGSALLERVNYSLENQISFPMETIRVEAGRHYAMVLSTSTPNNNTRLNIGIAVQGEYPEGNLLLKAPFESWQPHPLGNSQGAALKFALRVHADFQPLVLARPTPEEKITAPGDVVIKAAMTEAWREEEIVRVDFYESGALLGSVTEPPYEMIWTNVPPGRHLLQAKATTVEGQELVSWTHPVLARPPHDDWSNASPLSGRQVQVESSNRGATTGDLEMFWRARHGGPAVFYAWTAPASGTVFISEQESSLRHGFRVYAQSPSSSLGLLTHNLPVSGGSQNIDIFTGMGGGNPKPFYAEAGHRYFIAVGGILGEEGDLSFRLWQPPVNDSFVHRIVLRGAELQVEGDNTAATLETIEPAPPVELEGKSVWYSWTAPASGEVEVAISEGALPIAIHVYTGPVFDLRLVAGNLADPSRTAFKFPVVEGETYEISVDTFPGSDGAFAFGLKLKAVEWVHPPDFARFAEVAEFPLEIVPPPPAPAVREVRFFAGEQLLGQAVSPPFRTLARLDSPGKHSLRAVVLYTDGSEQISAPRTVLVAKSLAPRQPFLSAGTDRSYAVDVHGNLYAWGAGIPSRRSHPQKIADPQSAAGWRGAWQTDSSFFGLSESDELHEQFRAPVAKPQGVEGWLSLAAADRHIGLGTDHQLYLDFRDRLQTPGGVSGWVSASGRAYFGTLLALGLSGEIYFWENVSPNFPPKLLPLPELNGRVVQLETVGPSSHLVLSLDGKVYRANGLLAFPEELGAVSLISGGGSHYLALGARGRLYGSGGNGWQQLGALALDQTISDVRKVESPAGLEGWLLAKAGGEYSLALDQDGSVYGWGNNSQFQVGPMPATLVPIAAPVPNLPNLYGENPIRLASPANGLTGYIGQTVEFRPDLDALSLDVVRVFYFAETNLIGSGEGPEFSFEWTPVAPGGWRISAVAMNSYGALRDTVARWIRFHPQPRVELSPARQVEESKGHQKQTARILNDSFAPLDRWRLEISNLPDGVQVANGFMKSSNQFVVEMPGPINPGATAEVEILYYNPAFRELGEALVQIKLDADWPPPEHVGRIEILRVVPWPDGAFTLEFLASSSLTCQIERSLDLQTWENISEEFIGAGRPMRRPIHPSSEAKPAQAFFRLKAW